MQTYEQVEFEDWEGFYLCISQTVCIGYKGGDKRAKEVGIAIVASGKESWLAGMGCVGDKIVTYNLLFICIFCPGRMLLLVKNNE